MREHRTELATAESRSSADEVQREQLRWNRQLETVPALKPGSAIGSASGAASSLRTRIVRVSDWQLGRR